MSANQYPQFEHMLSLFDFERASESALTKLAHDYYAGGAHDEITVRENRAAFERRTLRPRVLAGVEHRDLSVELLGRRHEWPLVIAPTAFARLAHEGGETAVARAAASAGVTQTLSTLSTMAIGDVAAAHDRPLWFQLYVFRDREVTRGLVERAEAAGCEALVLTVDTPLLGHRERDSRNRFALPDGLTAANLLGDDLQHVRTEGENAATSGLLQYFSSLIDPGLSWADIGWLRSITDLPILVKGVVRGDDARLSVDHGAAGVIVSNHGGRQLDTAIASLDALPEVAAEVGSEVPVLVDGGVRRGTDIVKALALGARAVLIGRPVLWGLAVAGEAGVEHVLSLLREEVDLAMALCGCRSISDVTADILGPIIPTTRNS